MRLRLLFIVMICFFASHISQAQLSTKHYIPPITTSDNVGEQYIYISTPRNQNIPFTITPVGGLPVSGIVSNNTPYTFFIGTTNDSHLHQPSNETSTVTTDKGYIIDAEDVVYVSVRLRSSAPNRVHAGALVSKGLSALGTQFRAGGLVREGSIVNNGSHLTFVSVMATEDNTVVTFDDIPPGAQVDNYTGSFPLGILLNEGETYMLSIESVGGTGGDPNDLIGASVVSNKPIVVNSGSASGSFTNANASNGRDYGIDQIVDFSKVGNEYIFVRANGANDVENVLLVAHEDNTEISIGGSATIATINAGDYWVIEGDNYSLLGNMYVNTSKPVFAYQGIGGEANAPPNQGMFFVPPLSCENRGDVDNIAFIDVIGGPVEDGGVIIVTNVGSTVTINNLPIADFNTTGPLPIEGNANYVTYRVDDLAGNVSVQSDNELYCSYFNRDGFAASGSFYSGFPSPPEINLNATVATLGNCIPNLTLNAPNTNLFDAFEWYFDDGNGGGFVPTGIMTDTFMPSQAGTYKLIASISCSGSTFESVEIPVSLCPDDLDNDLIIDNVDIDLDNDGITSCDESRGNVVLDYTNINDVNLPVILNFNDNTTDGTFITPTIQRNGTTTISGDNASNFLTNVSAGFDSEISYTMAFAQSSNIEFTQNTVTPHTIVTGETFSLIVGPSTKNITLIDPDNILMVDTDFDGEFELGVDNFSASEVRFRFNPTPNGTTPFRLVASEVDEVTFSHNLRNLTEDSSFTGNLIITCFTRDSDGDGIPDSLDADSDNDGIPDLVEASGRIVVLTGNDSNLDGLDDVFVSGPVTPVDSDGDGIPDYLDLDSDNDGVYDLFEAGHTQPDADLDGRIDNALNIVGANGLVDALETAPDNFTLAYTISNPNADLLISSLDLDNEGDNCFDVIEAGFIDGDNDGIIGTSPVQVDALGKVINIPDGYTVPNANYSIGAPILLNNPFVDPSFCEASTSTITIDSNANVFQWEISTDGGNNWSTIVDNAIYSGATTTSLQITNILQSYNGHQFRVAMQRTGNSCGTTSNAVTLTVEPLPVINALSQLTQCDDNNDGFSNFNLFEAAVNISPVNHMNETFVFYPSLLEAQNDMNALTVAQATAYGVTTTGSVGVRVISAFGCYSVGEVDLTVSASASQVSSFPPISISQCDDFLDIDGNDNANNDDTDGITSFDFSFFAANLIAAFPMSEQPNLTVTYYRNVDDALAEQNAITDPANYRNRDFNGISYANTQQIFVRVDSDLNNDCVGLAPLITLIVDPVPTATDVMDIRLCDDGDDGVFDNGIIQTFDLESQTASILNGQDPTIYDVTYHRSAADARLGINAIGRAGTNAGLNPNSYENQTPNRETIYVRVTNTSGSDCFTDHVSFDVIVEPLPVANPAGPVEVCDDDSDGSAQNGISQSIPIRAMTESDILGTQDPAQFSVSYHTTRQDALDGLLPLNDVISNQDLINNIVYVRVFNSTTMCANGISQFEVIVHPEPSLPLSINNYEDCDDSSNGTFRDGIISTIDLETKIPEILPGLDATQFNVTFHDSPQGAIANDNSIPKNQLYQNTAAYRQTVYVRVENINTGCVNDDRLTFDIVINDPPVFELETPRILCLGESIELAPINEGPDNYDYEWILPDGTSEFTREIEIRAGGTYRLIGRATNGNQGTDGLPCSFEQSVEVIESQIPTITEQHVTIVDDSNNNSITIDPTNLGAGDYEYALRDEQGNTTPFQDSPVFENLSGGFYTIIVNDKNGCGFDELEVAVLEFPKFFTPNNDGRNDTWAIKGANSTFFPSSEIVIFNRFGKIVARIDIDNPGWNGTFNGKVLPSDDYWFSISLTPRDTSRPVINRKGNFSLIRR